MKAFFNGGHMTGPPMETLPGMWHVNANNTIVCADNSFYIHITEKMNLMRFMKCIILFLYIF